MRRSLGVGLVLGLLCGLPSGAAAQVVVHTVALATDGSGDATAYARATYGTVLAMRYVPNASTPLDTAASLTITDNITGLQILSVSTLGPSARDFWPRAYTMTTTGTNSLYAAGGTNVLDLVPVAGAIKVVVAAGGATKSGTLYIYIQGR